MILVAVLLSPGWLQGRYKRLPSTVSLGPACSSPSFQYCGRDKGNRFLCEVGDTLKYGTILACTETELVVIWIWRTRRGIGGSRDGGSRLSDSTLDKEEDDESGLEYRVLVRCDADSLGFQGLVVRRREEEGGGHVVQR